MAQTRFSEILRLNHQPPDEIVRYGESKFQFAEYWHGSTDNSALVIVLHGGCWLSTYKADHIRPLASALNGLNYAVWSLEYRRVGNSGGGWPGSFEDILDGINAAGKLDDIDADNIFLLGHSAGGHLALWAGAAQAFPRESPFHGKLKLKVRGVVALAAISNLNEYALGNSSCERATLRLLGGAPVAQPERYRFTSPHLLATEVKTILIHGRGDHIVSPEQSERFSAGSELVTLISLPDTGHFDVINPDKRAFDEISAALTKLSQ